MLMKPHCRGNLFGGILCSSGLWAGFQRRKSRGIFAAFLSAHHPSPQCRTGCRFSVKMKGLETLGSFLVLTLLGFWAFSLSWSWWLCVGMCQNPFSEAGSVWIAEVHHWDSPQDGVKARDADSPLGTEWLCSSGLLLQPVAKWVRNCDRGSVNAKLCLWKNPSALKAFRNRECSVSHCNTTGKKITCAMFSYWFSFSWCSIFNLNGSRLRHRMGRNVLSSTTGKRAWFSDFVSVLSN